ncbi:hypothetical protein H0H92_004443 [Tricholoma furcatifolium]|nr:hypothetical protein H0H92_004443 [Tricholoma furcatifolium]
MPHSSCPASSLSNCSSSSHPSVSSASSAVVNTAKKALSALKSTVKATVRPRKQALTGANSGSDGEEDNEAKLDFKLPGALQSMDSSSPRWMLYMKAIGRHMYSTVLQNNAKAKARLDNIRTLKIDQQHLKAHAIKCFGDNAVQAAFNTKSSLPRDGSIFAALAHQEQQPITVSHRALTSDKTRVMSHTGTTLVAAFHNMLIDHGLEKKIMAVNADNATSNDMQTTCLDSLANSFTRLNHVHCFNHTLQLAVKALLHPFSKTDNNADDNTTDIPDLEAIDDDEDEDADGEMRMTLMMEIPLTTSVEKRLQL